jgi:alpha-1,2-mannosyltransferase
MYNSLLNLYPKTKIANIYFILSSLNVGMFLSSTAFLPSTFAMYCTILAYASLIRRNYSLSIFGIASATLLGWPFAGLIGLPIAIDMCFINRRLFITFLKWYFYLKLIFCYCLNNN